MSDPVFQIVYCSRNAMEGDRASEIDEILATSRARNQAAGITGALLFTDGSFVQILEGEFDAVQATFERIQGDLRHDDLILMQAEMVTQRNFGSWTMAHVEPGDLAHARAILTKAVVQKNAESAEVIIDLLQRIISYHAA